MVTFVCEKCGHTRTAQRRRCYPCTVSQSPESREKIRRALTGVKHSPERVTKNRESHMEQAHRFDIGAVGRGKPAHNRKPVGSTRVTNGHTQIKCADGKWRYRGRVVWAAAHGPIPQGMLIHHRNENPHDDRLENLQMVTRVEHARIHSKPDIMKKRQARTVAARKQNGTY